MSETTDNAAGERCRDEFAAERREKIIEALSWWEDEDGHWGHERASAVLAAHEAEWCGVPATPDAGDASEHHLRCCQRTGVPADLPAGLCDCQVLRMLDAASTDASEPLSEDVEALSAVLLSAGFEWDGDDTAPARAVLASGWLAAREAAARAEERERIAQAIEAISPLGIQDRALVRDDAARIARLAPDTGSADREGES